MRVAATLTLAVRHDLATARVWYDQKSSGLGDDLAADFYAAIERLCAAPDAQTRFSETIRKRRLRRFLYSVYFHCEAQLLLILALIHRRRSPEFVAEQLARK